MVKTCFIHSGSHGHVIESNIMKQYFENHPEIKSTFYDVTFQYGKISNLLTLQFSSFSNYDFDFYSFRSHLAASNEVKDFLKSRAEHFDILYIQTPNLTYRSIDIIKKIPTILVIDAPNIPLAEWGWNSKKPWSKITWLPSIFFEKEAMKHAQIIIVRSKWAAKILVNRYDIKPSKIRVVPSPITIPNVTKDYSLTGKPKLLFIGGDFERKGGRTLLACFSKYFANSCELHLVTSHKLPRMKNVIPHSGISDSELDKLYRNADIFVFPTVHEPYGRVVEEAMSYGLPVISSRVAAIPEMIPSQEYGYLIQPNNSNQLKRTINFLLQSEETRKRMGLNSQARAQEKYDEKMIVKKLEELILSLR